MVERFNNKAEPESCLAKTLKLPQASLGALHEGVTDEFMEQYPLTEDIMSTGISKGDISRLSAGLFRKLRDGSGVSVLDLGGSFTYGEGCIDEAGNEKHSCAWVGRTKRWFLNAFPRSNMTWFDKSRRSTTSALYLTGIGAIVRSLHTQPDLVLIDTLVNDACEPTRGLESLAGLDALEAKSAPFEALVIALAELLPEAQLLIVEDACPECLAAGAVHTQVAEHHGIPVVNFAELVRTHNRGPTDVADRLWPQSEALMEGPYGKVGSVWPNFSPEMLVKQETCCTTNHPPWVVHQYLADTVTYGLVGMLEDACASAAGPTPAMSKFLRSDTFWPKTVLDKFPSCSKPLSYYLSSDSSLPQPRAEKGDWNLTEDRPGKPGWIATAAGATLIFPVKIGKLGALTIAWLTSYEGVVDATASLSPVSQPSVSSDLITLEGTVSEHFSTVTNGFFGMGDGLLKCPEDENSEYELKIQIPDNIPKDHHFKIVEVTSC